MNLDKCRIDDKGHELPVSTCSVCGYSFDSATRPGPEHKRPRPGDFSLCLKCGEIYVFEKDMTLRPPTVKELCDLGPGEHRELQIIQTKIRETRPLGI